MSKKIKMRLLALDKKQIDLLPELTKRGITNIHQSDLSRIIKGIDEAPKSVKARQAIFEILDMWEKETASITNY